MAKFITNFIGEKLNQKDLELYNTNYITERYKAKEADVVYKIKGKEIYYLIEQQTKVDYSMAYRILNYCIEIIRNVIKGKNINKKTYRYPIVIPIVLYIGDKKWTAKTEFEEIKEVDKSLYESRINVRYKLIDVNEYKEEELLKQKTMLGNVMLLEKCKNNEETMGALIKIIKNTKSEEQLKEIERIIKYQYGCLDEEEIEKLLKLIEEREEKNMSTLRERLAREYRNERKLGIKEGMKKGIKEGMKEGMKEGIKESIFNIVNKMLKMDLSSEFIEEVTGVRSEEIDKIRKELKMA